MIRKFALMGGGVLIFVMAWAYLSTPAWAYVRVLSSTGHPFAWQSSSVAFTAYQGGLPGFTPQQFGAAVQGAARVWSRQDPALASCTYLDLRVSLAAATDASPPSGFDQTNNVTVATTMWAGDPGALAVTAVFARSCGQIIDTDIDINAVDYAWTDLVAAPTPGAGPDLQNALTHEMGHAIGLGHPCFIDGTQPIPVDDTGAPIPDCGAASPAIRETTMFPSADPHDVSKRTLSPDDQKAVCDIYPLAQGPNSCAAADAGALPAGGDGGGCGCVAAPGDGAGAPRHAISAALLLLAAALLSRRPGRRPGR